MMVVLYNFSHKNWILISLIWRSCVCILCNCNRSMSCLHQETSRVDHTRRWSCSVVSSASTSCYFQSQCAVACWWKTSCIVFTKVASVACIHLLRVYECRRQSDSDVLRSLDSQCHPLCVAIGRRLHLFFRKW